MRNQTSIQGFTLVELSVVLVILSILTAMGVAAGLGAMESAKKVATENRMDEIERALFRFRDVSNLLPCPADASLATSDANYGVGAANPGSCTDGTPEATNITVTAPGPIGVPSGAVPVKTLGLPLEYMYDGWGRKFQYEVVADLTYFGAFNRSSPWDVCADNGITIRNEHDDADITNGAVYALNSFGPNGIGAYLKDGSHYAVGTPGTLEAYANRLYSSIPLYVYKFGQGGSFGSSNYYDDILRFKTRTQLMNDEDRNKHWYRGPQVLLAHESDESAYASFVCGRLSTSGTSGYADAESNIRYGAFTANNAYVFLYNYNMPACKLYPVTSTALGTATSAGSCPSNATVFAIAGSTNRLAMNLTSSPYVRMWDLPSNTYTVFSNPLAQLLPSQPTHFSFSDNGEYFTASRSSATAYARLYKLRDGQYQMVSPAPSSSYTVYNNAVSPNGQYYVAAVVSGANTIVHMWRLVNGTFVETFAAVTITGMNAANHIQFSPDSEYVGFAGGGSTVEFAVMQIMPDDTLALGVLDNLPDTAYTPQMISFTPNNSHVLLTSGDLTQVAPYYLYRRTGSLSFLLQTMPVTVDTGAGEPSTVGVFAH